MDAFSNFQPLVPDEECLQVTSTMSGDGGGTDDGIGFSVRRRQQTNESHSTVLSRIGNFAQAGSDVMDQDEISDDEESGILVRFVEGRDTMYGAPNACSTGLSYLQPEIIDTLSSLLPKKLGEFPDEDTACGFQGFSTTGARSPLSQHTIDSSSSAESLSQHSFLPRAGLGSRRQAAVGMCYSEDSSPRAGNLQGLRMFNETLLSEYPCSSSNNSGGASPLSQHPMGDDVSGLIDDFDTLIQGTAVGDGGVRASHLTVVDAFSGVAAAGTLPQFTVVDAFVGDTEAGGSRQCDRPTELPQFTIVDTFVDGNVPGNLAQEESRVRQRWAKAQFDVVDAVVGSLGRNTEECQRDDGLVTAECKTLEITEEDALRLERPPVYPLNSVETCKTRGVDSLTELQMTAGLKTYTYKEPELGDLQQITVSPTRPVACSISTFPESGDCELRATASVTTVSLAKPTMFTGSPQLMSGDTTQRSVATSAAKSTVLPDYQQMMSGDLLQTSAGDMSHLIMSSSQSQGIGASDAKFATPHSLQQRLFSSGSSHLNNNCGSDFAQSVKADGQSGGDTSHRGYEMGNVPDGASQLLPRIPVVREPILQSDLAEILKKQKWMPLTVDEEMSELEKTMTSSKNDKPVEYAKTSDSMSSGYPDLQWKTLKAKDSQMMTSDLPYPQSTSMGGLPFDVDRTENSIRLSMDILQMSIGDTLVHTGRAPLGSSTPIVTKEDKDRLTVRRLQAMQTIQDSEERSDSGRASRASSTAASEMDPAKLEARSGSDVDYMPAEERRRLLEHGVRGSFGKDRAGDGEHEGHVSNQTTASAGRLMSIIDEEAEVCRRSMQSRSNGVGEELNVRSGPKSTNAVSGEMVEDDRNVELEWAEKPSGRRSRTASSSGCSLGDSAPDFRVPTEPGPRSVRSPDRLSTHSGSFEDLRVTYQRREPLGEERRDVKQVSAKAVRAGQRDGERDSCSEGSDVDRVHQLYLSCLGDEDTATSEEEDEEDGKMEEKEGDEEEGIHEEEEDKKSYSVNLVEISGSREDLITRIQRQVSPCEVAQTLDVVDPVGYGASAVVVSDGDSLASSLPRGSASGSDIEDGLSEDVKRILEKYGRRFSSLKSDVEKTETEIRQKLKDGNLNQLDGRISCRMEEKPLENEISGNDAARSPKRNSKSDSYQSGDFPENFPGNFRRADPKEASKMRSEDAEKSTRKVESSVRASMLRKLTEQTVDSSNESSDDTLGRRVNDLLTKTDKMLEKKSEVAKSQSRRSSAASSQTGSVDYGVLQKDLDELEMSLDSMKRGEFSGCFQESKVMSRTNKGQVASGVDVGRTGLGGLHLLLTSGLVPVDVALDMVHGGTDDLSDDGGTNVLFSHGLERSGISETVQDSVGMKIAERSFDDKSDITSEADIQMNENQRASDAFTHDRAVTTTQSGFGASQSNMCDSGRSRTLEAKMDEWSQSHISSFPETSVLVDDDGSSRSRGSFQENVTTQRGPSRESRSNNASQINRTRDSIEANVTIGRGSNSFRESVTKNFSTNVAQGSEVKNTGGGGGVTDGKETQSSGYSGSGSLPRSDVDVSLGLTRVARAADQTSECPEKNFTAGQPLMSSGWSGKSPRPVQGSVSPKERPMESKSQSEMMRNQVVNKSIDDDSYLESSVDSVGGNKSEECGGGREDARTSVNLVSNYRGGSLNSRPNQAWSAPRETVHGFQIKQLTQRIRDSDITVPHQRTSYQDNEISGVQRRYADSESEVLSHNKSSFSGSLINNNDNNLRVTPISDVHELDSFEDTQPISAMRGQKAVLKHDRAESTGQPIASSDFESPQEEGWTEQILDRVEPDAYYLSESMLESGDDQIYSGNATDPSFVISPLRKHSPFRASRSVQLLLAAQLNRVKVLNCETNIQPMRHIVTSDAHRERGSGSGHDLDNASADSSGTLVVNDSAVLADETLKPVAESLKERSGLKVDEYPSDHDSQLNSHEDQSSSSAVQHTSLTTVTSLRDSTDCDNNLIMEFPTHVSNRPASTSPTIVPYRPVNSRDVYYVDSGTDDGSLSAGHSEATVESTHAGSDDARAPNFPAEVLGTRSVAPMDAMRIFKTMPAASVSKPTDLSTIDELSVVLTSNSDRHISENSVTSKSNNLLEKSRQKEFEESFEKTKNWVNGISSSLPDMCTPSKAHRTNLGSMSDSSIQIGSRDGQRIPIDSRVAGHVPTLSDRLFNVASGMPMSGEHTRKAGDTADSTALLSGANERSGEQVRRGGSKGVAVSTTVPHISPDKGLPLSRVAEENRPPLGTGISTEPDNRLNSMPTFALDRDKHVSEMIRSMDLEENAVTERRIVNLTLKPDDHDLQSLTSLDHFVADRFTGRFESHYGLTPGIQSIVEQYADGKGTRRKGGEVEEELNRTHTVIESPFRSSRDPSGDGVGESVRRRDRTEQTDLNPSKSLDSILQMKSLTESSVDHASKSRSNTLPGQVAETLTQNSENPPQGNSGRFSKDAFVSRLWEKFHESGSSESESSGRRAETSALQLVSLVNNPVRHIVEHLHRERDEGRMDVRESALDASVSRSRIDEGTSLRSADSYQTYVMDSAAGRPWDLAREAAAGKDGERPSGSYNNRGTARKGAGDQSTGSVGWSRGGGRGLVTNGAGEKSSSDDEREERRRKLVHHGDYGKADVLKKLLEKEEREKRKQEEGRGASSGGHRPQMSKRAWIIQDEVLPIVPENRTIDSVTSEFTSSSVDESGKVVTRTTKRHLPGNPKLLKLQQKIARQKEKYKQAYVREHRRKERITQLEMIYQMKQSEAGVEPTNVGSSLESFSQPPSVGLDSTPQNITSDNSAFCFNCSETDGSACVCVRLKSKHPALQKSLPDDIAHGIRMRKSSPTKKQVGGKSAPVIALDLREVDYSEEDRERNAEFLHQKRAHGVRPRRSSSSSPKRSGGKVALTKGSPKKTTRASPERNTSSFMVGTNHGAIATSGRNNHNSEDDAIQRKLKSKSVVDFGMNFPTPRHEIRRSLRSKGVQTTPRLENPTLDARPCVSERRSYRGSRPYDVGVISIPVRGRVKVKTPGSSAMRANHGTSFVAEARDDEWHLQTRSSKVKSHKIRPRKSFPCGIAWFLPLDRSLSPKRRRQPKRFTDLYHSDHTLTYTQLCCDSGDKENTVHLDRSNATIVKESIMDVLGSRSTTNKESASATVLRENANNSKKLNSSDGVCPNASEGFALTKGDLRGPTLQELFRSNMQAFISRSRQREKHIALRAEERRIQQLHAKERLQLFGSLSRGSSVLHTDPACEHLFKPRKRWFSKQQMKMMTNRRYRNLPEVMKMVEQKQKTERCQANRQRVQMFKQKILSHVLSEKNRRTVT